jgi:type VI secretion system secreted protein VgrG
MDLLSSIAGEEEQEIYDYHPRRYTELEEGERYARLALEALEAGRQIVYGESNCRAFTSGYRFALEDHSSPELNQVYTLAQISHSGSAGDYRSGGGTEGDYHNSFLTLPHDVPYRPQPLHRKPTVHGSQTAIVVGPSGEEIYTDSYGRVKVQFYWDRLGSRDENSSCWIRVGTPWGGGGYGAVSIPRIGNEVIVDFLEGDPDRPLIVGSVYNANQMPPLELPGAGIEMGMKSRSSPGGGGANQISMRDTAGEEMMTVTAQYDMNTSVGHDQSATVTNDRSVTVDGKLTETIKGNTTITVSEGTLSHDVQTGTATYHVQGALTEDYSATQTTTATGRITINSSGAEVHIMAASEIKLSTGDSLVQLKSDGTITISGKKVQITGGDEAKMGVGNQNVTCDKQKVGVAGAAINSSAVGMHEIAGALVKIN